jgi:hypothetical protein
MFQPLQTAFAVISSTIVALSAQDSAPAKVELRMLAFSSAQQKKEAFAHDPLADATAAPVPAPIKTYLNHQGSTVFLKSRKIVFTTKIGRDSLKIPEDVIGAFTLPLGLDSAILLFLPGKDKNSAQIMAIDDSKRAFPAGSFHATNLSPLPIKLILEEKQFDFKSGQAHLIEDPPTGDTGQTAMRTFSFRNNAWGPVATSLWPHPGDARSVLIFYQNPNAGEVQLRSFVDVPPREPQTAATP